MRPNLAALHYAVFFTFCLFAFHINLLSLTLLWQLCFLVAQVLMAV